jgi:two-component sensor histidine kinase
MNDAERPLSTPQSQLAYWVFQLTGWGLYSLSRFIGGITVIHLPWVGFGLQLLFVDAVGLGLSHLLRDHLRRHVWRALPFRKLAWRILIASFICGLPLGILTQFTEVALLQDPNEFLEGINSALRVELALPVAFAMAIVNCSVVFLIWQAIYFTAIAVREHRSAQLRQSELARALQMAELRLLKSQLNPHFLFNALNTVRSLIAENPRRAQSAVTRLANTLRYSLRSRSDETVTLAQELDIVTDYLELESMRFEDRLRVEKNIAADATKACIPVMLLQTLIENAIKHGITELPSGGLIKISAVLQGEMLSVEIENTRPPSNVGAAGEGVGLRNAQDRLRLLFGSRASLELDLSKPAVATARLRVPQQP